MMTMSKRSSKPMFFLGMILITIMLWEFIYIPFLTKGEIPPMGNQWKQMGPPPAPSTTLSNDEEIANALNRVVIDPSYSHAAIEHPEVLNIVRECFNKKGAYVQFEVEHHKRYLRVCLVDEKLGILAFQIVDLVGKEVKERTAYIKDGIKSLKELFEYAQKNGWVRFKGPL